MLGIGRNYENDTRATKLPFRLIKHLRYIYSNFPTEFYLITTVKLTCRQKLSQQLARYQDVAVLTQKRKS